MPSSKNLDIESSLRQALSEIKEDIAGDDEEVRSSLDPGDEPSEIGDDVDVDEPTGILALANIPFEQWDEIKVSPNSRFGDSRWDFTCYPHVSKKQAIVNFDYENYLGLNISDGSHLHWFRIIKALCLYRLPRFSLSGWVRSYGGLNSQKTKTLRLLQLFKECSLYLHSAKDDVFRTLDDVSDDTVRAFIDRLDSPSKRWELASMLMHWQRLSKSHLLPPVYSVVGELITDEQVSAYRKAYDDVTVPYKPIPLDDYAEIVNHCVRLVEDYSQDILWLYTTYYPTLVGKSHERHTLKSSGLSTGSVEGVAAFKNFTPRLIDGEPWWTLTVLSRSHPNDAGEYISYGKVARHIASLMDACCTVILATTGMRRSEVMHIKFGAVSHNDSGFWLRFTVFKTSVASQGISKLIPIPLITARAISVIETLCAESRQFGQHDFLFSSITRQHFGWPVHSAYPERAVKRVAEACGVDSSVHPHRFRKSLAMYLIYQDPRNIEVIRHLFSHSSMKMTLRYIMSLPGVHDEVKKIIIEQNVGILVELLDGVLNQKIGGEGGKRVKDTVAQSPMFKARLQDLGKESLNQYVDSMLEQGIKLMHRSNLAICLKTPGVTEVAPCDGKGESPAEKLHPNLFACDPFGCRFAAFTESHLSALTSEIVFHQKLALHPYCGTEQRIFSERRIREAFKRLAEVDQKQAEQLRKEVANGQY